MSSNVAQNYPYTSESEAERAAAVEDAFAGFEGLRARVDAEASPLGEIGPDERWWVWICPADGFTGRLHVAGYGLDRHAVYTICAGCGRTFLR